jgi:ribosome-binding factor A
MTTDRMTRVNELLKREIATALFHVVNERDFDPAAVTITRVLTDRSLKAARVFVSIRARDDERPRVLERIRSHRGELQALINENLTLRFTPRLTFELDRSIEKGDAVLGLLAELERSDPGLAAGGAPAGTETKETPSA